MPLVFPILREVRCGLTRVKRQAVPHRVSTNLARSCKSYKSSLAARLPPVRKVASPESDRAGLACEQSACRGKRSAVYISNVLTTSGGAGSYLSGSIEALARP